jgi:serine/threonine protein kinase
MTDDLHPEDVGFARVRTIDPGGRYGIGGANAGVYLVRRRRDGLVCVEKRLPAAAAAAAAAGIRRIGEIDMMRRLRADHPNIVHYIDSWTTPRAARIYMEHCELGSLADAIERLLDERDQLRQCGAADAAVEAVRFPEAFIWHVFFGLVRALVFMRTRTAAATDDSDAKRGWQPILHRDIKPENVFLQAAQEAPPLAQADNGTAARSDSRSNTNTASATDADTGVAGDNAYPGVALGDWGWAISTHDPHLEAEQTHPSGTPLWQGPELPLQDPLGRSDVWAVGATIQSLCRLDSGPVRLPPPRGISSRAWMSDPAARQPRGAGSAYSGYLNLALAAALELDVERRLDAYGMLALLTTLHRKAAPMWAPLPSCALGVEDGGIDSENPDWESWEYDRNNYSDVENDEGCVCI